VVLLALWSPKGGSGTSVLAAACALVLGRRGGARLADLDGDQPALFGLAADPPTGLADWLAAGPEAPTDALERLTVEAATGVALIPRGTTARPLAPVPAAEAGAALAVALRDGPVPTVADLGRAESPAARAVVEVADASLVVVRGCYLTLRRAVHAPALARATGAVLVAEPGRSLGAREVTEVLDRPVLAEVPVRAGIARAVDAGLLPVRLPDVLVRPTSEALGRLGLLRARRGQAA
jgi:MinD-like ATPase involved in chromosome partitioning or flagellar assembly